MPTINQLIRKGRRPAAKRTKAPALRYTYNSLSKVQRRGRRLPAEARGLPPRSGP